ncbi:MAG: T9SS type A sorting domain-containing protein [Bacteroidota bacterium]
MTPPGTVSVADQARIIDYLVNYGGNLYVESVNLGTDHFGTDMMDSFGIKLVGDGETEEVETVHAEAESFVESVDFEYKGGDSPHYSVDRLTGTDAELLYASEDDFGRIYLNDYQDTYKVISSSVVMAALRDGDSLSMKPYLMAEMINYFLGVTTITDIREAFGNNNHMQATAFPNPFRDQTNIGFSLRESSSVTLQIIDQTGKVVKTFAAQQLPAGENQITWDASRDDGAYAANGIYFYRLTTATQTHSGKLILNR